VVPHLDAKAIGLWKELEFQDWNASDWNTIYDTKYDEPYAAVINGKRSVLIFSDGGNGLFRYGVGSGTDPSNGQFILGARVYDPTDTSKGEHSYPYYSRCIAFDANDLEQVRLGSVLPKNVKPYAVWNFVPPFTSGKSNRPNGVAFDSTNNRLFLSYVDAQPGGFPIIHVYSVS
jgi:hypothetical protein